MAQTVKRLPAMWKTWVWSLGREDPLEKEMATHSSTLAWKIPWPEEPCRLQSLGLQRVRHDWATSLRFTSLLIFLFSLFTTENLFLSLPGLSLHLTFKFCYSLEFIPWLFSFLKFLYPFWTSSFSLMTSLTILRTNVS